MADERDEYASSPCQRHELDPAYLIDSEPDWDEVKRWRAHQRQRLIESRLALSESERESKSRAVITHLKMIFDERDTDDHSVVAVYWPIRGEPDLRPLMRAWVEQGVTVALPVVIGPDRSLEFRAWTPYAPMTSGVWDIPVPAEGKVLTPTVVIAPCVGFDRQRFRLGHGGGFYDRTLANLSPRPVFVGVAYSDAELHSIYPQPHDIPCDAIVTDAGEIHGQ